MIEKERREKEQVSRFLSSLVFPCVNLFGVVMNKIYVRGKSGQGKMESIKRVQRHD